MKRSRAFVLGLATIAMTSAWGCSVVIGLGDKPTAGDAGVVIAAAVDAGQDSSTSGLVCGLIPNPNQICQDCYQKSCCAQTETCAADPQCPSHLECIKSCLGQGACVVGCLSDAGPALKPLVDCSVTYCGVCNPPAACVALGACFDAIDGGAGFNALYQGVVRDDVLALDPAACDARRKSLASQPGGDVPACQ